MFNKLKHNIICLGKNIVLLFIAVIVFQEVKCISLPAIDTLTKRINTDDYVIDTIWNNYAKHEVIYDVNNTNPDNDDISAYWKAAYNPTVPEIYLLVSIADDVLNEPMVTYTDSALFRDHVSIFFDFYNYELPEFDDGKMNFRFWPGSPEYTAEMGLIFYGYGGHMFFSGIDYKKTDSSWFVELVIRPEYLLEGFELQATDTIGFEVAVIDNDSGVGEEKHYMSWSGVKVDNIFNLTQINDIVLDKKDEGGFDPACESDFEYSIEKLYNPNQFKVTFTNLSQSNDDIISYAWSFGDGASSGDQNPVYYFDAATETTEVCLVISTLNECMSNLCKTIEFPEFENPTCHSDFNYEIERLPYPNQIQVTYNNASQSNESITSYNWSFGDGNSSAEENTAHVFYNLKAYTETCFSISTINACRDTVCKVLESKQLFALNGKLNASSNLIDNWQIHAFIKDQDQYTLTQIEPLINAEFSLLFMSKANYLLYAIPSIRDADFFPTYFVDVQKWQNADGLMVDTNVFDLDIRLNETLLDVKGEGTISGTLNNELKHVPIILAGKNKTPLSYTLSNEFGQFEFMELPYGDYWIYPEYPGLNIDGQLLSLSPDHPSVQNLQFVNNESNKSQYQVFYNGKDQSININSQIKEAKSVYVKIFNSTGQILYQTSTKAKLPFSLPTYSFQSKVLIIHLSDGKQNMFVSKVIPITY